MNKEEFLKAIENVPKTDIINPISAYNSINVEDLANAVDRFKKVPTYDELLKENHKYKEVIEKAIEYLEKSKLNQLDTYCKHLYIDFDTGKIENIDELLQILKGEE